MSPGGGFIVTWESNSQDASGYGIYAQRYTSAAVADGSEFRVNTYTTGNQYLPAVTLDASGDVVVAWTSSLQDGSLTGVYAQCYKTAAPAEASGSEFRANTDPTLQLHQLRPAVASDAAGNYVVAWEGTGTGDDGGIFAQRYSAAGNPLGGQQLVNATTANSQSRPAVAMDSSGDFVVVWTSNGQDGSNYGVYGRRFDAAGVPQGAEFRVNTYTTSHQWRPSVAMDSDGDFVVVWQSLGQDSSGYGVYAAIQLRRRDAGERISRQHLHDERARSPHGGLGR